MTAEHWLPVPGWPEYSISNRGRVRSERRVVTRRDGRTLTVCRKIRRPYPNHNRNNMWIALIRPGERRLASVNALVREAFGANE